MTRYICLIRFTAKGAQAMPQSIRRAKAFEKSAQKAGVKIEGQYWTVGRYDGVLILSASKKEKALNCLAELAASGFVLTETLEAFNQREFAKIIK